FGPGIGVLGLTGLLVGHRFRRLLAAPFDSATVSAHQRFVPARHLLSRFVIAVLAHRLYEEFSEFLLELSERDAVLWSFWSRHAGFDSREVELEKRAVVALAAGWYAKHSLRLVVTSDHLYVFIRTSGCFVVSARLIVDRKESHRGAVFGRHIGDGRAIGGRERGRTLAVILDKFPDDFCLAEHLGQRQHEVGRGDALLQSSVEVNTD